LMYVSVPDFDSIMKNTPIYELFPALREQIAAIAEIVISNGGDIDKIMGEKLLIAFHLGDKTANETAINAAKAAHLIENNPNLHFKVAVGVNYGLVISGYLGVGQKRDFTIIGDSVNVTARIASFAEKLESNKCVVSEGVMSLIKSEIKTEEYGEVRFKGKALPAKVYRMV
ncbi:MAG: adenylate/guanylate cyclase domain-containing protein, partial [Candidatus Riflebacteria bacterium]|nr:adenylate/guanylate cyclase domain-containing protein [Candidatus Riflebacteria bacterium]